MTTHSAFFSHGERYVLRIINVTINRKNHLHEHNSNDSRDENSRNGTIIQNLKAVGAGFSPFYQNK
jgi:hypothetical protein